MRISCEQLLRPAAAVKTLWLPLQFAVLSAVYKHYCISSAMPELSLSEESFTRLCFDLQLPPKLFAEISNIFQAPASPPLRLSPPLPSPPCFFDNLPSPSQHLSLHLPPLPVYDLTLPPQQTSHPALLRFLAHSIQKALPPKRSVAGGFLHTRSLNMNDFFHSLLWLSKYCFPFLRRTLALRELLFRSLLPRARRDEGEELRVVFARAHLPAFFDLSRKRLRALFEVYAAGEER